RDGSDDGSGRRRLPHRGRGSGAPPPGEVGVAKAVRRLVTGHHADGRSTVLLDGSAPNVRQRQAGNASTLLWATDETPAKTSRADRAKREIGVPPPRCGTIFRLAEFPPGA